mmetsp:Transcript_7027/g.29856  ORF Transcript_7027/g.29856 Transcript_7027/m.29856 type:complete len:617 (+) Transcript_7027:25-1875(+)
MIRSPWVSLFFLVVAALSFHSLETKASRLDVVDHVVNHGGREWTETFCDDTCILAPQNGPPGGQRACGQDLETHSNFFCANSVFMKYYCDVRLNVTGIMYAGDCGCPNDCMSMSFQGSCQNGTCVCEDGWGGPDCSQVVCPEFDCRSRGVCQAGNSTAYCECEAGFAGTDCNIASVTVPPVTETVPSTQYSSWDDYGNDHPLFNVSTVATVKLTMSESDLQWLLDPTNKYSKEYMPADFWIYNGNVQHSIPNIGVRTKGGFSRRFAKKSWKFNFNHFLDDDDNDWLQVGKIDMKGFQTDNSKLRDPLSLDIDYSMNGVTERMGWAQMYINEMSFGYFLILESIDNNFLKSRFGTNDGALYKCQASLEWYGWNITTYQSGAAGSYSPKTNEAEADSGWEALVELLAAINLTTDEEFPEAMEAIFDMDLFIRTFVFEVATGNWDGLRDANNFYLFQDPNDNLWKYIRHDMDASFGALPQVLGVGNNSIYEWALEPKPGFGMLLYNRVLAQEKYRLIYTLYLESLIDKFFVPSEGSVFWQRAMAFQQLSDIPVRQDYPCYFDCGWTYDNFVDSYTVSAEKPVTWYGQQQKIPSILDWSNIRISTAKEQMQEFLQGYYSA